jgi:hypothetical protein
MPSRLSPSNVLPLPNLTPGAANTDPTTAAPAAPPEELSADAKEILALKDKLADLQGTLDKEREMRALTKGWVGAQMDSISRNRRLFLRQLVLAMANDGAREPEAVVARAREILGVMTNEEAGS